MTFWRRMIAGARWSDETGHHPGTVPLLAMVAFGCLAGAVRGGWGWLVGGVIMLVPFGSIWLIGCYERGKKGVVMSEKETTVLRRGQMWLFILFMVGMCLAAWAREVAAAVAVTRPLVAGVGLSLVFSGLAMNDRALRSVGVYFFGEKRYPSQLMFWGLAAVMLMAAVEFSLLR